MNRYLDILLLGVLKSSRFHHLSLHLVLDNGEAAAKLATAFDEDAGPLAHGAVCWNGVVVAFPRWRDLVALEPSAGFQTGVSFLEQGIPVVDASDQAADVDEVKVVGRKGPFLGAVFNFTL